MEQSNFATRLRLARGRRGFTIAALAGRAGVSATAITDLELGRVKRPRIQTVVALADALGIDPADLVDPVEAAS